MGNLISAWFGAVLWSGMIRLGFGYDPQHILNWGGGIAVFLVLLAGSKQFSDSS